MMSERFYEQKKTYDSYKDQEFEETRNMNTLGAIPIRPGLVHLLHEQEALLDELTKVVHMLHDRIAPISTEFISQEKEKDSDLCKGSDSQLFNQVAINNKSIQHSIRYINSLYDGVQL